MSTKGYWRVGPSYLDRPPTRKFIALEGLDGAGTTTQTRLVAERLLEGGVEVHPTREPTAGPLGAVATQHVIGRSPLNEFSVALTFSADRIDHLESEIVPKLEAGFLVLTDRYYLSTLAYQGMKLAVSPDIEDPDHIEREALDEAFDWIWDMNRFALRPTATIFLDVPPDICARRTGRSRYTREAYDAWPTPLLVGSVYSYAVEYAKRRGDQIFRLNGYDRKPEVIADDITDIILTLTSAGRVFGGDWGNVEDALPLED